MTIFERSLASAGAVAKYGTFTTHTTNAPDLIDADPLTYITNYGALGTRKVLHVDLGGVYAISSVLLQHQGDHNNWATAVIVWWSNDNSTWTNGAEASGLVESNTITFEPISARYWMIECTAHTDEWWRVEQLALYEDDTLGAPYTEECWPTPPTVEQLEGWLAHLDAEYVPAVSDYLAAN